MMSEWISVTDRLPDTEHYVLTFRPNTSTRKKMRIDWFSKNAKRWVYDSHCLVTHWMPLPNPPEVNNE